MTGFLPTDFQRATLVGRMDFGAGPTPVVIRDGRILDVSRVAPTVAGLLNALQPGAPLAGEDRGPFAPADYACAWDGGQRRLLAPIDLQCIKAAGVTFAASALERVIEEKARGDADQAHAIRAGLVERIGVDLAAVRPGSAEAARLKSILIADGAWSQYLEVAIGNDAEIFTKAPVLSAVGWGDYVGIRADSDWNNPEPEVVLLCDGQGRPRGAMLGNDVNLRDFEGRSALLLGKAKDNNGSCSLGPFVRLFDEHFGMDDVRRASVTLEIAGVDDGFRLTERSEMSRISRDPLQIVEQAVGRHHQYPDGFAIFLGTMFAPVKDRSAPGRGFTHCVGDIVRISSPQLGVLENKVAHCDAIAPWTMGIDDLMRNLAGRGLLRGNAKTSRHADDAPVARARVRDLAPSKVREVANAGFGQEGILRFWFGESDEVTPAYIRESAMAALEAGRTFYTHNQGIAELRAALADYLSRLHTRSFDAESISVTSSGVSALMIAMQALLDPGDRVVIVTPVWPNLAEIPRILGAEVVRVGLEPGADRWRLDLQKLFDAITPRTRLLLINSPGNPSGWALAPEDRLEILQHCRRHGVWIITDDVYERLYFPPERASAPGLLQVADARDRVMGVNSFSKAWLMTGWRLGWIVAPGTLGAELGKLIEYNTSCTPEFVQRGGVAAIEQGEPHVARLRLDLRVKRDYVIGRLRGMPGIEAPSPEGGMYAFFRLAGCTDSVALAKRLIAEAGLGLAPGAAFGPEGEGWLRWCFAADRAALGAGLDRLQAWLQRAHR